MSFSFRTPLLSLVFAAAVAACAATHEEPPAPPPPPIDPAAFSGTPRPPAAVVDIGADLDASVVWADSGPDETVDAAVVRDAGSDAQVKGKKR